MPNVKPDLILILGAGRGGTSLVHSSLQHSKELILPYEYRVFVQFPLQTKKEIVEKAKSEGKIFGTKMTIEFCRGQIVREILKTFPNTKIVFVVRDGRDNVLSKIRRGAPKELGGDAPPGELSGKPGWVDDCTSVEAACGAWNYSMNVVKNISHDFPNNCYIFKYEDLISDFEGEIKKICSFLHIEFSAEMVRLAGVTNRNRFQAARYATLKKDNVELYKDLGNNWDGFFHKSPEIVSKITRYIKDNLVDFSYAVSHDAYALP